MSEQKLPVWRFVGSEETPVDPASTRTHYWHCKPGMVEDTNLLFVRVQMEPGGCHNFHHHPHMEEILYVLSGTSEQWVDKNKKIMRQGDSVYIPAGTIHGTFNVGPGVLDFLAILTPAKSPSPGTVEVGDQEPYKSWRTPSS
jgi:quercetin dioxygenase-like cupin family protein